MSEPNPSPTPRDTRTIVRWAWRIAAAGLLVYGLFWVPGLAFHFAFQRLITTGALGERCGGLLRAVITPEAHAATSAGDGSPAWAQVPLGSALVAAPIDGLVSASLGGETLSLDYGARGKLIVDRFPPGLIGGIFAEEIHQVGGDLVALASSFRGVDDGELLVRITNTTPDAFHLGMNGAERTLYAAAICSKMRIWDIDQVLIARRLEGSGNRGVALYGIENSSRAIVASPEGVFVFTFQGIAGPQTRLDPCLDIEPAGEEVLEAWKREAAEAFPEGHPLRVFADRLSSEG
jgi:hypothetical protein